jgi:hypothetical protein
MITNWQKYQQYKYKPISSENSGSSSGGTAIDPFAMHTHVYDKDGNYIVDSAETIEGLGLSGPELKARLETIEGFLDTITGDLTVDLRVTKDIEYITLEADGQRVFKLSKIKQNSIVELRINRTWIEESSYTVKDGVLTLDESLFYKKGKQIDVIYYNTGV